MKTYDLSLIDQRFPQILEAIGWTPTHDTHDHIKGPCPIHNGTDSNFHLDLKDGGRWVSICRSQCGGSGWSATRFIAELEGIPHSEAIEKAAQLCQVAPTGKTPTTLTLHQREERAARIARQQSEIRKKLKQEDLTKTVRARRDRDLQPYLSQDWKADLWHDSPTILPPSTEEQARLLIAQLFQGNDTLWLGSEMDSGQPRHASNFRLRDEWLSEQTLPPRIAAGTFQPGCISRSAYNLSTTPYIVVESDDLIGEKPISDTQRAENKRKTAALFGFMADRFKLTLRAVIDTGNRSLHGWFDRPSPPAVSALIDLADALAIDAPVITQAHRPLRLPGCLHTTTGKPATLYYLNPISL